jgi:tetratricopeptide (TPR) repeat protein
MEYLKQNKKKEALQTFGQAISLKLKKTSPGSRQFKEYLSDVLIMEWVSGGYDALSRQYRIFKEKYPRNVNESLLNGLGYVFLGNKLYEGAVQIMKLNVEVYPNSANAYDSLGEAYMNSGDKKRAIENYEKSLKLNPENASRIEKLKQLKGEK